jgi:hypothetical protein
LVGGCLAHKAERWWLQEDEKGTQFLLQLVMKSAIQGNTDDDKTRQNETCLSGQQLPDFEENRNRVLYHVVQNWHTLLQ